MALTNRDPHLPRGPSKRARTRAALIEAAIGVIAEQPGGFSVSDVTSRAGVSHGTFYNYFDDREALLDAVVPEILTRLAVEGAEFVAIEEPVERFATITTAVLLLAAEAPHVTRVLLRLDAVHRAVVEAPVLDHMRADILAGHGAGAFLVGPDAATLDVVVGTILLAARRLSAEEMPDGYVPRVVASLLRSLGVAAATATAVAGRALRTVGDGQHDRTTSPSTA